MYATGTHGLIFRVTSDGYCGGIGIKRACDAALARVGVDVVYLRFASAPDHDLG